MFEYVSDADVGHGYFRENEESEQHSMSKDSQSLDSDSKYIFSPSAFYM